MKPVMLVGIVLFVVFAAIGVYYIIPMSTEHIFTTHGPHYSDVGHALVAFVLAIVALVGGRFVANSGSPAR